MLQTVFTERSGPCCCTYKSLRFVNYLVKHTKASIALPYKLDLRTVIPGEEFSDYTSAGLLKTMNNSCISSHTVENIDFDIKNVDCFWCQNQPGRYFARNYLPWYREKQPYLPPCVKHMSTSCFHASEEDILSGSRRTLVGKTDNRGWWRTEWCMTVP